MDDEVQLLLVFQGFFVVVHVIARPAGKYIDVRIETGLPCAQSEVIERLTAIGIVIEDEQPILVADILFRLLIDGVVLDDLGERIVYQFQEIVGIFDIVYGVDDISAVRENLAIDDRLRKYVFCIEPHERSSVVHSHEMEDIFLLVISLLDDDIEGVLCCLYHDERIVFLSVQAYEFFERRFIIHHVLRFLRSSVAFAFFLCFGFSCFHIRIHESEKGFEQEHTSVELVPHHIRLSSYDFGKIFWELACCLDTGDIVATQEHIREIPDLCIEHSDETMMQVAVSSLLLQFFEGSELFGTYFAYIAYRVGMQNETSIVFRIHKLLTAHDLCGILHECYHVDLGIQEPEEYFLHGFLQINLQMLVEDSIDIDVERYFCILEERCFLRDEFSEMREHMRGSLLIKSINHIPEVFKSIDRPISLFYIACIHLSVSGVIVMGDKMAQVL